MDAVYMVKPEDRNEELRYSLRSLANMPFITRVVMVGYLPNWVKDVHFIPRDQRFQTKYVNTTRNMIAACEDPEVSDEFMLMNDDFFVMHEQPEPFIFHRGPLAPIRDYYLNLANSDYAKGIQATEKYMRLLGLVNLKSYELHVPLLVNKKNFLELIRMQQEKAPMQVVHKRTLYGNYYNIGGRPMQDCKIVGDAKPGDTPFLSTDENSFERYKVGEYIRNRFKTKSRFEI